MNAYEASKWWKKTLPWNELNVIKMKIRKRSDNVASVELSASIRQSKILLMNKTRNEYCHCGECFRREVSAPKFPGCDNYTV